MKSSLPIKKFAKLHHICTIFKTTLIFQFNYFHCNLTFNFFNSKIHISNRLIYKRFVLFFFLQKHLICIVIDFINPFNQSNLPELFGEMIPFDAIKASANVVFPIH
jgi:hypothetical protein